MSGSSSKRESWVDVSERAKQVLDFVIDDASDETIAHKASQVPVSQSLHDEHVVNFDSGRVKSRILFITSDQSLLESDSWLMLHVQELQTLFAEIHVMVLTKLARKDLKPKRISKNVWAYNVPISHEWRFSQEVQKFAREQLQFTDGFRPDVIVSLDPFEAGLAGMTLAEEYGRPYQVHILEDFLRPGFIDEDAHNKKRLKLAKYVLRRTESVRLKTEAIKHKVIEKFPKIEDVGLLPRHFDMQTILNAPKSNLVKQKYPQYKFVMLAAGDLDKASTFFRTMDASRILLMSPRIGLVIVGDGPSKVEFQKRAEILGIKEQIVFETDFKNLVGYLKSADVFICTDITKRSDELVIKAAVAGLPLVVAKTELREDLFVDGESAYLCDPEDTQAFTQKLKSLLNTNAFRMQFGRNAQEIVKTRLHEDPALYKTAYRDSIEVVFGQPSAESQSSDT